MVKKVVSDVMERGDDQVEAIVTKPGEYVDKFAKSKHGKNIGSWAFIIGFIIAVLAGLVAAANAAKLATIDMTVTSMLTGILVLIGVIVGLVNISGKESVSFLVAAIAIMSGSAGFSALASLNLGVVAAFLNGLVGMIAVFVAPAAIIVALRVIYSTAREA